MIREFKQFIERGNAVDLAIGVVVGAAFGSIVKALVDGLIMPLLGLLLGRVDFTNLFIVLSDGKVPGPYSTLAAAQAAGASVLAYGLVINSVVSFLIISFSIFVVVKAVNVIRKPPAPPAMMECPYCLTSIRADALRCPACTSMLAHEVE